MHMHSFFSKGDEKPEPEYAIEELNLTEQATSEDWIPTKQLEDIFDRYRIRQWDEELKEITNLGGIREILARLKTSERGLLDGEATDQERLDKYGSNKKTGREPDTFIFFCQEALGDLTMRILLISGIVSLILGATINPNPEIRWIDGFAIIVAVAIVVVVTGLNDYEKQKKLDKLSEENKKTLEVQVLDKGKCIFKHPENLHVGDILVIHGGTNIPADGIVFQASELICDEQDLTSIPDRQQKRTYDECITFEKEITAQMKADKEQKEREEANGIRKVEDVKVEVAQKEPPQNRIVPSCVLLAGSDIESGSGLMVVCAVGKRTLEGKIHQDDDEEPDLTELQVTLNDVANNISVLGLCCSLLVITTLYLRFGFEIGVGTQEWHDDSGPSLIVEFFSIGITLLQVAVPEGLPLAVSISLAYSVLKMQSESNLVRSDNLQACEKMGQANVIWSDKTGTITSNKMEVVRMWIASKEFTTERNPENRSNMILDLYEPGSFSYDYFTILKEAICVNSTAFFIEQEDKMENKTLICKGSKTECALLKFIDKKDKDNAADAKSKKQAKKDKNKKNGKLNQVQGNENSMKASLDTVAQMQSDTKEQTATIGFLIPNFDADHAQGINLQPVKDEDNMQDLETRRNSKASREDYPIEDYHAIRDKYKCKPVYKIFDFTSKRKASSAVISLDSKGHRKRVYVKGSAEMLIDRCTRFLSIECERIVKTPQIHDEMRSIINKFNKKALRTLAIAFRDLPVNTDHTKKEEDGDEVPDVEKKDLTLISIVAIQDPIKEGVEEAVEQCRQAHLKVFMTTGDSTATATSIAKQCKILGGGNHYRADDANRVCDGDYFYKEVGEVGKVCRFCKRPKIRCECSDEDRKKREQESKKKQKKYEKERQDAIDAGDPPPDNAETDDEEDGVQNIDKFIEIIKTVDVIARTKPEHKYALVTGLKQIGLVVATTGSGSSDSQSLSHADIGFAMGMEGTDLAKESAGIQILDDNFCSIVHAVVWGRNIFENIRRFIQFQLTVNIVAVTSTVVCAFVIKQSPLTPVQLLWVNLIMDTLASLALATERPVRDILLKQRPAKRDEYIVTKQMWKHIFGQAFMQFCIIFPLIFIGETWIPESDGGYVENGRLYNYDGSDNYIEKEIETPSRHFTMIFNTFVLMQLFNEINSRKIHDEWNIFDGIQRTYLFISIWVAQFVVQILMVQIGSHAMKWHIDGLTYEQWFICLCFGLLGIPWKLFLNVLPLQSWMPNFDKKVEVSSTVTDYLDFMEEEWKIIKQKADEEQHK